MNREIGYFEYNGILYYLMIGENKTIKFYKKINEALVDDFSLEENEVLFDVCKSLIISEKDGVFIKRLKLNQEYDLYYDKKNSKYYWRPLSGKENVLDNILLNNTYNYASEILFGESIKDHINNPKYYKHFIKLRNGFIALTLAATLSVSVLSDAVLASNILESEPILKESIVQVDDGSTETLQNISTEIKSPEEVRVYNYEEIKHAIDINPYLDDNIKDILYALKFVFDENHQYMDLDLVINRLTCLKVEFNVKMDVTVSAYYNQLSNAISMKTNTLEYDFASFLHELFHVFQLPSGNFMLELSNQFFTNEAMARLYEDDLIDKRYFYSYYSNMAINNGEDYNSYSPKRVMYELKNSDVLIGDGYSNYLPIYYALAEIVSPEALTEYQFNPDNIQILANELMKYDVNTEEPHKSENAYQLLDYINGIRYYDSAREKNVYIDNYDEVLPIIMGRINYYYKLAKGISMKEDMDLMYYVSDAVYWSALTDEEKLLFSVMKNYVNDFYGESSLAYIFPKTYLSSIREYSVLVYGSNDSEELYYSEMDEEFAKQYYDSIGNIQLNGINNNDVSKGK